MEQAEFTIPEALDIGVRLAMEGRHPTACTMFRGVLIHEPENFEAIERLGTSLFAMGQYHEALYWFWRGRKLNRKHPLALTNYGLCVSQLGHWEEGLTDIQRAVYHAEKAGDQISPGSKSLVYNNLGNTLERLLRHDEALVALDKGISCDPTDPFPWYNRGIALLRLNRHEEAIESINKSLTLAPPVMDSASRLNEADARYNRGMAYLLLGDLKRGFEDYEYRLLTSENQVPNLGLPAEKKWSGQDIAGERILVHAEQGLGDTIQFLRFVPLLIERGATIQLVVHNALKPIAAAMPGAAIRDGKIPSNETEINISPAGNVKILDQGEISNDSYDYWVALMSLPAMLGLASESEIPAPWWPEPDPDHVARWADRIPRRSDTINVGVCWAGNFQHKNDAHRSIPLAVFSKLFDAPVNFISLQQMQPQDTEAFAALKEKHPANLFALWVDDFRDTAAVMRNLDLVISVDTAVAHVAGTLGVPCWTLIPKYSTDWRWMLNRTDCPWYPSMRLIRQERIGDWESIIGHVKARLGEVAETFRGVDPRYQTAARDSVAASPAAQIGPLLPTGRREAAFCWSKDPHGDL
jgi:Flp pilus assembly protein TadD/ADP-heptose:LPS heptosyltransferase